MAVITEQGRDSKAARFALVCEVPNDIKRLTRTENPKQQRSLHGYTTASWEFESVVQFLCVLLVDPADCDACGRGDVLQRSVYMRVHGATPKLASTVQTVVQMLDVHVHP